MWTIAAVNKKINGPLGSYNGLTDVHLAHYFSRPNQQSHLKAAKLITNDGAIIPEQKFKIASLQYEKKKKMYDMLANSVIQNAAHKEGSWNKKLCNLFEDVTKMENVEKIKIRSRGSHKNMLRNESSKTCSAIDPSLYYNICEWFRDQNTDRFASTVPRSAPASTDYTLKNYGQYMNSSMSKGKRCFSAKATSSHVIPMFMSSPYMYNSSNTLNHTLNIQKNKKRKKKYFTTNSIKPSSLDTWSTKMTKLSMPDQTFDFDQCKVTLYYHGHTPLNNSQIDVKEEVLIRQQHCGGTPVIVYKGFVSANETLKFITLSHEGFTFSITLFLDGIRYLKLSSCCIYRYPPGKRLGGSSGNFSIQSIEGGKPCMKCQYREVEACSKDLRHKLICEERDTSLEVEINASRPTIHYNSTPDALQNNIPFQMNEQFVEDYAQSSVASEIIHSVSEKPEDDSEILENEDEMTDNEIIEDGIEFDEDNVSITDDINVSVVELSNHNSISSQNSTAESLQNFHEGHELEIKPYQSESSEDEDGFKQHVILASVHGSPNGP